MEFRDDATHVDWLVQVAALERPDVIYLVPVLEGAAIDQRNDDLLLMSPPGDGAVDWLASELERMSRLDDRDAAKLSGSKERAFLGVFRKGPAEDLNAEIVEEQSSVYHTVNRTQAELGTYGKLIEGNRLMGDLPKFESRGLVQQLDRVRRFATIKQRGQSMGKDFLSLVGSRRAWQFINLGAKASGSRKNDVAFEIVGIRLDPNDVITAINSDSNALAYFDYLKSKDETPCLVLENLVFTNYSASQGTTTSLGIDATTTLTPDSAGAQIENERTTSTQFTSPVIRCYQMYKAKLHQNRVVELVNLDP